MFNHRSLIELKALFWYFFMILINQNFRKSKVDTAIGRNAKYIHVSLRVSRADGKARAIKGQSGAFSRSGFRGNNPERKH